MPQGARQNSPETNPLVEQGRTAAFQPYQQLTPNVPGYSSLGSGSLNIPPTEQLYGSGASAPVSPQVQSEMNAIMAMVANPTAGPTDAQVLSTFQTPATGSPNAASPEVASTAAANPASTANSSDANSGSGAPQIPFWMYFAPNSAELLQNAQLQWEQQQAAQQGTTPSSTQPSDSSSSSTDQTGNGSDPTTTPSTGTTTDGQGDAKPSSPSAAHIGPGATGNLKADLQNDSNCFFSQFNTKFNPNANNNNENCGPTSLLMAAKMQGAAGAVNAGNAEQCISQLRVAMTNNANQDAPTSLSQVESIAQNMGMQTAEVSGLQGIDQALANGDVVVSAGNPGRPGVGDYGPTLTAAQYNQFNGAHIITIVGKDGNNYIINDPLSKVGSLAVTGQQLQAFINDPEQQLHGGIAISPKGAQSA